MDGNGVISLKTRKRAVAAAPFRHAKRMFASVRLFVRMFAKRLWES